MPSIFAFDADHNGNRELLLRHDWTGRPLDLGYAEKTLEGVERLWGRKVWLETRESDEQKLLLSFSARDGHQRQKIEA
jgi:stage V sporulation protein R